MRVQLIRVQVILAIPRAAIRRPLIRSPAIPVTGRPTGYPNGHPNAGARQLPAHVSAPRTTTQPANGYPATAHAPAYGQSPAPGPARTQRRSTRPQNLTVAAQIGSFFRDLRRNFKISQPEIASRLGTRIEIIAALEAGDVRNLPSWPETCRIVQTYTGFAGLDPRPVLRLIEMMQMRTGRQPTGWRIPMRTRAEFSRARRRA